VRSAGAVDPEQVVRRFCEAVSRLDVDELRGFFTEDAIYHNIPIAPVQGRAAIEAMLRQFIDPDGEAEFEIRALATHGHTVLTERIDRFVLRGKRVELPVMGAFEVTPDGRIAAWRDYFDLAQFTRQVG
jgi:limonene-1,2-epoxide hydrolase